MVGEGESHGCVVPKHVRRDPLRGYELIQHAPLQSHGDEVGRASGKMRDGDGYAPILLDIEPFVSYRVADCLFEEEHASFGRASGHEMLRTLKDEVPAEV